MKKGMILSAVLSVVGLMLVSCSTSEPEATTTTTRQTTGYNGSAPTSRFADDDNNDAYGRRLLIVKAGRGWGCCRHGSVGHLRISKSNTEFDRSRPGGYIRECAQDF